ncbi:hypothetical protein HPB48_013841 [Haemaphysalis longicornis]|uniref:Uncharacterized protein n=1 Tax=Haemaphysalis longicornis TaxID=44386 RepID=A0A9J6GVY0_HAELO|nr:hypothetical protein HPB48_013841 [Haemaphysalis longicornis]
MDLDDYYNCMRMTNAEQHEILREIIHRQTTPSAHPVTGLLHRNGRLRQDVRPPACHGPLQPVEQHRQQHSLQRVGHLRSTGKAAVAVGATTVHVAFKLSWTTTSPNKDGGLSASELNIFRVTFRNLKCVTIDEVSMMSADNLNAADLSRPHGCFAYYSGFRYGKMVKFFCKCSLSSLIPPLHRNLYTLFGGTQPFPEAIHLNLSTHSLTSNKPTHKYYSK